MARKLEGKVAVVTGASSGIGKSIVEKYVEEGARVVAFARNLDALKALEASCPGQVKIVAGDVTKPEDLQRLVAETVQTHGGVDIVVPNAGIARVVSFEDSTAEAFDTQFSVNLFGAAETARLFVPHIRKGGSIQLSPPSSPRSASPAWPSTVPARRRSNHFPRPWQQNSLPRASGSIPSPRARSARRCGERSGCRLRSWARSRKRSIPD